MKTWIVSHVMAFLTCFGNVFADYPVWTSIIGSYSELSVRKLYTAVRLNIYKCIEFFNLLYPSRRLIYGKEGREINLSDTDSKMDIGMELETGKQILYSNIYAFSTDTKKDGLTIKVPLYSNI
jgi:hypothetical protein